MLKFICIFLIGSALVLSSCNGSQNNDIQVNSNLLDSIDDTDTLSEIVEVVYPPYIVDTLEQSIIDA